MTNIDFGWSLVKRGADSNCVWGKDDLVSNSEVTNYNTSNETYNETYNDRTPFLRGHIISSLLIVTKLGVKGAESLAL